MKTRVTNLVCLLSLEDGAVMIWETMQGPARLTSTRGKCMETMQTNATDGVICDLASASHRTPRGRWLTWSADEQVIDVLHPNRGSVSKEELKEKLAKTYKV